MFINATLKREMFALKEFDIRINKFLLITVITYL